MGSVPVGADLLNANNWTFSNAVARPANWGTAGNPTGFLEGNAVADRDGKIVNVLRVAAQNSVAVMRVNPAGTTMTFDAANDLVNFNAGSEKVHILYDRTSDKYWAMGNVQLPGYSGAGTRNALAVYSSSDLTDWRVMKVELFHSDKTVHGFQYPAFIFEGNDILAVSRTAYDDDATGAHNFHDANYLTFHRINDFRNLTTTPIDTYLVAGNDRVAGQFEVVQGAGGPWVLNARPTIKPDFDGNASTPALANAFGLAQDNRGRIYVGEQQDAGRVIRFNSDKTFDRVMASEGPTGQFNGRPEAMTLGPDGSVFMSSAFGTRDVNRVYKIDINTAAVTPFTQGAAMSDPRGIAFASDGNLYVADRNNNVIRKFDGVTGAYLSNVPNVPGRPQALAWDADNHRLLASVIMNNLAAIEAYDITTGARTVVYQSTTLRNFLDVDVIDGQIHVIDYGNGGSYRVVDKNTLVPVTAGQVGHLLSPMKISTWNGGGGNSSISTPANWDVAPDFTSDNLLVLAGALGGTILNDRTSSTTLAGLNVSSGSGPFEINGTSLNFNQIGRGVVNLGDGRLRLNTAMRFTAQPIDAVSGEVEVNGAVTIDGMLYVRGTKPVTILGNVDGAGGIVKLDANQLRLEGSNMFAGNIVVSEGTVELASEHAAGMGEVSVTGRLRVADTLTGPAVLSRLSLNAGGVLDLNRGAAVIVAPTMTASAYQMRVADGTILSAGGDSRMAIGVIRAEDASVLSFRGVPVPPDAILMAYTFRGDSNLDGAVTFDDLLVLAQRYGSTGASWATGDTNGDQRVDFEDLLSLAQNYGGGPLLGTFTGAPWVSDWKLASSLVPEPRISTLLIALMRRGSLRRQ